MKGLGVHVATGSGPCVREFVFYGETGFHTYKGEMWSEGRGFQDQGSKAGSRGRENIPSVSGALGDLKEEPVWASHKLLGVKIQQGSD